MEEQAKKSFIISFIFIAIWSGIIFLSAKFLFEYLFPFVIALLVAWLMQKPAEIISGRLGIKKGVCAAILATMLYIILAGITVFLILKVFSFAGQGLSYAAKLGSTLKELLTGAQELIDRLFANISPEFKATGEALISEGIKSTTQRLTIFLTEAASALVKHTPSFIFSSIVALASTCYIAKDFDGLCLFVKGLFSAKTAAKFSKIKEIFKTSVLKMLGGYSILALVTFGELLMGLLILRVKNAFLIALVTAAIDILPVLGAGAVLIPWGILSLISGSSALGIGLLILYFIITLVRNFLEPKIVGNSMGINPLFILLAMFSGLKLLGGAGLIVFPVTLIVIIKYYKSEMENRPSR